jgi:hypothetical protein
MRLDEFSSVFVIYPTQLQLSPSFPRPSTSQSIPVLAMSEFYLTAAIIVILALAVMFIISKVQE